MELYLRHLNGINNCAALSCKGFIIARQNHYDRYGPDGISLILVGDLCHRLFLLTVIR